MSGPFLSGQNMSLFANSTISSEADLPIVDQRSGRLFTAEIGFTDSATATLFTAGSTYYWVDDPGAWVDVTGTGGGGGAPGGPVNSIQTHGVGDVFLGSNNLNFIDDILTVNGGIVNKVRQVNADTAILGSDEIIEIIGPIPLDEPSFTFTIDASAELTGKKITIKDSSGLVNLPLYVLIDASPISYKMTRPFQSITMLYNGTAWEFLTDTNPLQERVLNFSVKNSISGIVKLYDFSPVVGGATCALEWDADLWQPRITHAGADRMVLWFFNQITRQGFTKIAVFDSPDVTNGYAAVADESNYFTDTGAADTSFDYKPIALPSFPMTVGEVRLTCYGQSGITEKIRAKLEIESRGSSSIGGTEIQLTVRGTDLQAA